jgi:hypothetical protein
MCVTNISEEKSIPIFRLTQDGRMFLYNVGNTHTKLNWCKNPDDKYINTIKEQMI